MIEKVRRKILIPEGNDKEGEMGRGRGGGCEGTGIIGPTHPCISRFKKEAKELRETIRRSLVIPYSFLIHL